MSVVNYDDYKNLLAIQQAGDLNPAQRTDLKDSQDYYNANPSAAGDSGSDPALQLIQQTIDSYTKQMNDYNSKLSAYDKANPFNFDDMLAKEEQNVSNRISPYYDQVMGDFLHGVNITKQRSLEDANNLATELQADSDAYVGQAKQTLGTTLQQTGEQFADAGSYDSGARGRAQGIAKANTAYDIGQNQRQTAYNILTQATLPTQRLINVDIPYETAIEQRDINQQKAYNIQAQAYPQVTNDYSQWQYNRQQAAGNPPGVNPVTWQSAVSGLLPGVSGGSTA